MIELKMNTLEAFFYHWILSFPMAQENTPYKIEFNHQGKKGTIAFLGDQLVQLEVVQDQDIVFSLHFLIDDIQLVSQHFKSFFDFMKNTENVEQEDIVIQNTNVKKILFVCSSGVSSSYFAREIEKNLEEIGMNLQVDSTYLENLKNCIEDYDIVFFAPQVVSHLKEYENYETKCVGIHSYDFGTWNFNKIINIALRG
ncbi:PTS sugar transporter subunit IIB [Floccifex sp.]|uniref:PTS sugar transporter subunit IIB n=1 Tax=Floccifex sp. TaxID=2815810 RepID=UPI003F107134